jgi:hypothetical protein
VLYNILLNQCTSCRLLYQIVLHYKRKRKDGLLIYLPQTPQSPPPPYDVHYDDDDGRT